MQKRFELWKRENAFTNLITVIYRNRYQEENRDLCTSVIREWRRYVVFRRSKAYLKECLQTKSRSLQLDRALKTWKKGTKNTIFAMKIQNLASNRIIDAVESLVNFSRVNARITDIAQKIVR